MDHGELHTFVRKDLVMRAFTQERLKEVLHYDPETGAWTWRITRSNQIKPGDAAGYVHQGYRRIQFGGHGYKASRLAHFYMKGEWPIALIDHINGDGTDDRWSNLRNATYSENNVNKHGYGESGAKGVRKCGKKFQAQIRLAGRTIHLGLFATPDEAAAAFDEAAANFHGGFRPRRAAA